MTGLRILLATVLSTALFWDVTVCRPANGSEDFRFDDEISFPGEGSGLGKTIELGSKMNGIRLVGSGDDEDGEESGSASGDDDSEDDLDLGSAGPEITIDFRESTQSSVITAFPTTELNTTEKLIPTTEVTVKEIPVSIGPGDRGSGHPPLPLTSTKGPVFSTTSKDGGELIEAPDESASGSGSGSGSGEDSLDRDDNEESGSAAIITGIIAADHKSSSELPVTTSSILQEDEDEEEEGSTDQANFSIDTILSNLTSESRSGFIVDVEPPRLSGFPASHTLSPDTEVTEEFLPVTSRKSTATQSASTAKTTRTTTSKLSSTTTFYVKAETLPPPVIEVKLGHGVKVKTETLTPPVIDVTLGHGVKVKTDSLTPPVIDVTLGHGVKVKAETLPPPVIEVTLGHGVKEDSTVQTTLEDTKLTPSLEHKNHLGKIEGRRRKPSSSDTTDVTDEEVQIGEISEGDEKTQEEKVPYFAIIAAALISAIVFFILGYITNKLKNRRGASPLPWKKDKMNLEASLDAGNGSAVQVYRDTNPDKYTSVNHEEDGLKDQAEVHPKPKDLDISDANAAASAIPMTDLSPGNDQHLHPLSDADTETKVDELKYIDETDEELEPPATSPLLEELDVAETDRGDLASQLLNTVDKNLNAVSENDRLLPPSKDANTSNGIDTI